MFSFSCPFAKALCTAMEADVFFLVIFFALFVYPSIFSLPTVKDNAAIPPLCTSATSLSALVLSRRALHYFFLCPVEVYTAAAEIASRGCVFPLWSLRGHLFLRFHAFLRRRNGAHTQPPHHTKKKKITHFNNNRDMCRTPSEPKSWQSLLLVLSLFLSGMLSVSRPPMNDDASAAAPRT